MFSCKKVLHEKRLFLDGWNDVELSAFCNFMN